MNSETAIVVAIVMAVLIVLSMATIYSGSLDQVGSSLFGENSDQNGLFEPDEDVNEFPTRENSQTEESVFQEDLVYDEL